MKYFKIKDFNFASYLIAKGAIYKGLEETSQTEVCNFVLDFPVPFNLVQEVQFWNSNEADEIRQTLRSSKFLKTELARYFKKKRNEEKTKHISVPSK